MTQLRVMTYNVHRCVGTDGKDSIASITRVCRDAAPDLIALQELDAPETDEDEGEHHARDLAKALGMTLLFCRTFRRNVGYYGHALLSRYPLTLQRVETFASPEPGDPRSEPRGAIWARATLPTGTLDIISTHLGVRRHERSFQSKELLGPGWLGSPDLTVPAIVCGDLNAIPRAATYRRIAGRLHDAQRMLGRRTKPTWPSRFPLVRIDHVFVSDGVRVHGASVPWNRTSRKASDHLPLVVDIEV